MTAAWCEPRDGPAALACAALAAVTALTFGPCGCATPSAFAPAELLCASVCPEGYNFRESWGVEAGAALQLPPVNTQGGVSVEATHKARCGCARRFEKDGRSRESETPGEGPGTVPLRTADARPSRCAGPPAGIGWRAASASPRGVNMTEAPLVGPAWAAVAVHSPPSSASSPGASRPKVDGGLLLGYALSGSVGGSAIHAPEFLEASEFQLRGLPLLERYEVRVTSGPPPRPASFTVTWGAPPSPPCPPRPPPSAASRAL